MASEIRPEFVASKEAMKMFGDEPPLVKLGVIVTYYCNLCCTYCSTNSIFLGKGIAIEDYSIKPSTFKSALKEAAELGCVVLEITGGEPFLYKPLLEILKYADDLGYAIVIATNGTIINEDIARELSRIEGINNLQITLDGSKPEIHNLTRRKCDGGGTFHEIIKNIRMLADYSVPVVVNTVVSKYNIHDIPNIVELSFELGAKAYKASLMSCFGRGEKASKELMPSLRDIINLCKEMHVLHRRFQGKILVGIPAPFPLVSRDIRRNLHELSACNVLIHAGIDVNGDVGPCVYYLTEEKRYVLGNLNEKSLKEIWFSPKFKEFRSRFMRDLERIESSPPCNTCIAKGSCYGVCPAMAYKMTGRFAAPSSLCWEIYNSKYRIILEKGIDYIMTKKDELNV